MAYALDLVDSKERLQQLHALDSAAYEQAAISFETFEQWWKTYDLGLRIALGEDDRIVGAIGAWGLNAESARLLIAGGLRERDLQPLTHEQLSENKSAYWYVSGVLIDRALRNRTGSPLRLLLSAGVGSILRSGKVRYPANVYALGYSPEGIALLEKLGFEKIRAADEMIDECPLYWKLFKGSELRGRSL